MNQKFSLLCAFLLLLLCGCRNEEAVTTAISEKEKEKKVVFFENYEKDKNFRYSTKWLNYTDTSNPAIPFAQSMNVYLYQNPQVEQSIIEKYGEINLWMSSEILSNEHHKVVFFPIQKDFKTTALLCIGVNHEHSRVAFRIIKGDETPFLKELKSAFDRSISREQYPMRTLYYEDVGNRHSIDEITFVVSRPIKRPDTDMYLPFDFYGGGDSGNYTNMTPFLGGSDSGGGYYPPPKKDGKDDNRVGK